MKGWTNNNLHIREKRDSSQNHIGCRNIAWGKSCNSKNWCGKGLTCVVKRGKIYKKINPYENGTCRCSASSKDSKSDQEIQKDKEASKWKEIEEEMERQSSRGKKSICKNWIEYVNGVWILTRERKGVERKQVVPRKIYG